ncbi:ABC transporter permease [uncultured Nocardioides sp.]|uniref:ABC transporter permease n=1 Tax=uncultured Nocardioides sp. TaxID=198441 RepID=UPI0026226614|nr:ABC transporter permease [uncultured Nocardioides sp.]
MRSSRITSTTIVYGVLLLVVVAAALITAGQGRNFFSTGNLDNILTATTILGLIAIGQTLVILVGSLDLSVPYVVSLASVVGGGIMAGQAGGIVPALLVTLLLCGVIGAVNGAIVAGLHVHGFIATLGTGLVLSGYLGSTYQGSSGLAAFEFRLLDATRIGPVPLAFLLMLGCAGLAVLVLRRTRLGHHLYAVGGNAEVARMSGLRTAVPVVVAHTTCSVMSGLAGLVLLARLGVGQPTVGSQGGYDLMSIAAVVLGGTLLAGGKGNIAGTLAGVAIFAVLDNAMGVMELNPFLKDVVRGVVIVVAVAVYARRELDRRPARFDRPPAADPGTTKPPGSATPAGTTDKTLEASR